MDEDAIAALARDVAGADHAVAFTGAGVSTASGIPDFRSEGGVWETHDQRDFQYSRFRAEPDAYWADRLELHQTLYGDAAVRPNPAHEALSTLEDRGRLDALVTQNVDGLHEEAGSESLIRLHGTSSRVACESCDARFPAEPVHQRAAAGELPPRCDRCDGVLKPDVVLFGESLPMGALDQARRHARRADVFVSIGSSLTVEPAASLPRIAAEAGATLAVINLDEIGVSGRATYDLRADVTDALPALLDEIEARETE